MNPILAQLLGESDVVPVIANVPRVTFRNRMVKRRQIEDPDKADDSVKRMVREAAEDKDKDKERESVIPDEAEEIDSLETVVGKPLRQPKEVVQEPSYPTADKERFLTPYSALTAPDVTPQSAQPIDPAQLPGASGPEKFTAADLGKAGETKPEVPLAAKAMDVLLGKSRAAAPPTQPGEFEAAGAIATEEQAAAALGIKTPLQEAAAAKAASLLVPAKDGGAAMPPPAPLSDGSAVYDAFRRFTR